jgi:hypothetical protein
MVEIGCLMHGKTNAELRGEMVDIVVARNFVAGIYNRLLL